MSGLDRRMRFSHSSRIVKFRIEGDTAPYQPSSISDSRSITPWDSSSAAEH